MTSLTDWLWAVIMINVLSDKLAHTLYLPEHKEATSDEHTVLLQGYLQKSKSPFNHFSDLGHSPLISPRGAPNDLMMTARSFWSSGRIEIKQDSLGSLWCTFKK